MTVHDSEGEEAQASDETQLAIVEEHIRQENQHDLEGIMATFGEDAWYTDKPWDEHHKGHDSVRTYYEELLQAVPDLYIDVQQRYVTDERVILEVIISGTQTGPWRGLPGTGRRIEFPLCAVYTFDDQTTLAGERIYYDRATVLRQLGIFHDPDRGLGRALMPLTHPITIGRAVMRAIRRR